MMTTNSPRFDRRFTFRLRTVLLLAVPLCVALAWIGYSLTWIRERQRFINEADATFWAGYENATVMRVNPTGKHFHRPAPLSLRVFGEAGVAFIQLHGGAANQRERTAALFPEAEIDP